MTRQDRTILVVDDDEDIRETVRWVLESSGYVVRTAVDGNAAWSKLHSNGQVSLILLDLMMPGMDGGRFLTLLRNSRHDKVPVVVIGMDTPQLSVPVLDDTAAAGAELRRRLGL